MASNVKERYVALMAAYMFIWVKETSPVWAPNSRGPIVVPQKEETQKRCNAYM